MHSTHLNLAKSHSSPRTEGCHQFDLGIGYSSGEIGASLSVQARKWFLKVAEQGHAGGQYNLGLQYVLGGDGTPQDYAEARKWFLKAAEQGHVGGQHDLGLLYMSGDGGSQDYAEARKWLLKAAEQGWAGAQTNLGLMHERGFGVPQDYAEAQKWFLMAAELKVLRQSSRPNLAMYQQSWMERLKAEIISPSSDLLGGLPRHCRLQAGIQTWIRRRWHWGAPHDASVGSANPISFEATGLFGSVDPSPTLPVRKTTASPCTCVALVIPKKNPKSV